MPNYTQNLNLEKPLQEEFYDVDKFNANADKIDEAVGNKADLTHKHDGTTGNSSKITAAEIAAGAADDTAIGNRTITDTTALSGTAAVLTTLLGRIGNMIKSITGKSNWYTAPVTTIEALNTNKAPLASPAFTGTPTAPTAAAGTNTTQIANTSFVATAIANLIASSPAALDTLNELAAALGDDPNFATTMTNALALKAPLVSPALTGTPTAPTATAGTNTTQIASTAFANYAANGVLTKNVAGGATVTLTAAEAAAATIILTGALTANISVVVPAAAGQWNIKNSTTGAYTVTIKTASGTGVLINQGYAWTVFCDGTNVVDAITDFKDISLTGISTAPTPAAGTNTTQLATTAYALNENLLRLNFNSIKGYKCQVTSNTAATITAGNNPFTGSGTISVALAAGTVGANGIDTGAIAASTWYYTYLIFNPTTLTTACLLSLSATAPTLPSGYTRAIRTGAVRTDSSGYLMRTLQYGKSVQYVVTASTNTASVPIMSSGTNGAVTSSSTTWVAVATGAFIPPTSSKIKAMIDMFGTGNIALAPNTSYTGGWASTATPPWLLSQSNIAYSPLITEMQVESTNIYWANTSGICYLYCLGWEDNL